MSVTLAALTFARSSMWVAIVPAVDDSRSRIVTSIPPAEPTALPVVAVALRVAVSVAAPVRVTPAS